MPALSVGLPVYNGEKWIAEALESILMQGFGDFDLVIVDNASTDDTEAICRAAAAHDPRIRYHRNPANIGVLANYDRAFELSSGRYFKWASCSDVCLQGFFEKCVAILEARADVVLAYPRAILVYTPPEADEEIGHEYDDHLNLEQATPSARFREYLNRERYNNVMNGVIRSAALRETALNLPLPGSDISMVAELALRGKFVEIPDRLFVRRFNPETTGILMDTPARQRASGYPGRPTMIQRIRLHSLRFVTAARAPIGFGEKLRVWLYLLRRIVWLRHQLSRHLARLLSMAR